MIARVPYEGLAVNWVNPFRFNLTLPWISLEIDIEEDKDYDWITEAIRCLNQGTNNTVVQKFLDYFQDYPVSYIAPRTNTDASSNYSNAVFNLNLDIISPKSLAQSLNADISQSLLDSLPKEWIWSPEMILNIAKISLTSLYDPLTVVTYLIGIRLLVESAIEETKQEYIDNLDTLRETDELKFFSAMRKIISQTYYVTSNIRDCISPAISKFSEASSIIESFLKEERGHDKLMLRSLVELTSAPNPILEPFESVVLLMAMLKYSANHSPLSFTCLIGHFEGAIYSKTDPFADVLEKSSRPNAAKGYAIHHQINMEEQHSKIIYELAYKLSNLTETEAVLAIRITELATLLGTISNHCIHKLSKGEQHEN